MVEVLGKGLEATTVVTGSVDTPKYKHTHGGHAAKLLRLATDGLLATTGATSAVEFCCLYFA